MEKDVAEAEKPRIKRRIIEFDDTACSVEESKHAAVGSPILRSLKSTAPWNGFNRKSDRYAPSQRQEKSMDGSMENRRQENSGESMDLRKKGG